MSSSNRIRQTTVGAIDAQVLAFTVGDDCRTDMAFVEADCLGSAAHVTMLSRMPVQRRLFTPAQRSRVVAELVRIIRLARAGRFHITLEDQDVHLAIERTLTQRLGALGRKIHAGRSRNDQIAVDLRLWAKEELLGASIEASQLARTLVRFGRRHALLPMVGRTHQQPAMPSSVGLWAAAHAESLFDDLELLQTAYNINDCCPLGAAAGYGVPLPIDRALTARLLGFARPCHSTLYAINARGKVEAILLEALAQVMLTLSRLAQDVLQFTMPEFDYFKLPDAFCTGSSIMPQKRNADLLELVRARATLVHARAAQVYDMVKATPSGYNRDMQETKVPLIEGMDVTRACVRILIPLMSQLVVNQQALRAAFSPGVFAADRALELVGNGMPFRDAYRQVREHLHELSVLDPDHAMARKTHLGAPAGLDFQALDRQAAATGRRARAQQTRFHRALSSLLGVTYPLR